MISTRTDCIYDDNFQNLTVTDIVDFKSLNVVPKIVELQNYFDNYKDSIQIDNSSLLLQISSIPSILDNSLSEQLEDSLVIYLYKPVEHNCRIENISVKYNEDYEYGAFDEYNLDADTIKSIDEYESIEECLSSKDECSYIQNYSYSIYLEISLKECT